jgi:hypothetical protein
MPLTRAARLGIAVLVITTAGCGGAPDSGTTVVAQPGQDAATAEPPADSSTAPADVDFGERIPDQLSRQLAVAGVTIDAAIGADAASIDAAAALDTVRREYGDERAGQATGVYVVRISAPVEDPTLVDGQAVVIVHIPGVEQTVGGPAPAPGEEPGEPLVAITDMVVMVDAVTGDFVRTDYVETRER